MTTPATHWQRHGMRVAVAEVLPALGMCRIRHASLPATFGWLVEVDPRTGGPRGYAPVVSPLCDCTSVPHNPGPQCPKEKTT